MAAKVWSDVEFGPSSQRIREFVDRWYPQSGDLYISSAYRVRESDGGTWSHHNGQTYNGSPTAAVDYVANPSGAPWGTAERRKLQSLALWLYNNFGDLTVEMLYSTPFSDDGGFQVRSQIKSGLSYPEHHDHIHYATSAALLDAMEIRAQKLWGGSVSPPSPTPAPDLTSTLYGYDGSDFTSVMDFTGLHFVTHKITEAVRPGEIYVHTRCGPVLSAARDQGIPFLGAYVVPRSGGYTPAEEAQIATVELRKQAPWALDHPGFFWQVDLEKWRYDAVAAGEGSALCNALWSQTGKPVILYASRGQYGDTIPGNDNLWNAHYDESGPSRPFKQMYAGPTGQGWQPYSGRTPVIWQYCSNGIFADGNKGDANAFRGNVDDFRRIILGQGRPTPTPTPSQPHDTTYLIMASQGRK